MSWHLEQNERGLLYVVGNAYRDKEMLKAHGFRWNKETFPNRWQGAPPSAAAPLWKYAKDPALRARLQALQSVHAQALDESRAAESDIVVPCPPHLAYMPFQSAGVAYALKRDGTLIADEMGLGKLCAIDTPIMTPRGWSTHGAMRVGDVITSSTGGRTRVIGVYPQGVKRLYRVTFSDGSSVEAGDEHLWTVRYRKGGRRDWAELTVTTEQIRSGAKVGGVTLGKTSLYLPMLSGPVEFEFRKELPPIPPYVFGALVANGYLKPSRAVLTVHEDDEDHVVARASERGVTLQRGASTGTKARRLYLSTEQSRPLVALGSNVLSREKRIPRVYMEMGSTVGRVELLQGLMDGDGSISKTRCKVTYHTIARGLADDVVELVEGLGGIASVREYDRTREGKPVEYQVRMRLPEWVEPFSVPRKAARYKPGTHARPCRTFAKIEYSRDAEAVCIAVDAPDRLYVTEHCILTHNTVQGCGFINAIDARRILIVCPASLRIVWKRHLQEWLIRRLPVFMANGRNDKQFKHAVASSIEGVFIVNYDILIGYVGLKRQADGASRRWDRKGADGPLVQANWDVVIGDEIHLVKNSQAQRSAAFTCLQARRRIGLTGTPIVNRSKELPPIARWIDPTVWSYNAFKEFDGAGECIRSKYHPCGRCRPCRQAARMQARLRETIMVRRLKDDVLVDLPPKRRQIVEIEPTGAAASLVSRQMLKWQSHSAAMEVAEAKKKAAQKANDEQAYKAAVQALKGGYNIAFEEMSAERRELAITKAPFVIEHLEAMRESGIQKIITFWHHHEAIDMLREHFGRAAVVVDGRVPKDRRQDAVDAFQTDDSVGLFIGGIIPAGVGLTLTAASHVVFGELDWVPGNMSQAEDRAHRIGQANSVLVQHLVFANSLDSKMAHTVVAKQVAIEQALDKREGVTPTPPVEIADEIAIPEDGTAGDAAATHEPKVDDYTNVLPF